MKILSSVSKALQVLDSFSDDQPELSVTEISKLLHSHKSSISRILITLASEGFVEKNPDNQKYSLGLKMLDLAGRVMNRFDLRDHAAPLMEALAQCLEEIVHLSILDKNEIVYLDKKGQGQALTVSTKAGGRSPAHASAMGKVLLSGLPEAALESVLPAFPLTRFTPTTITEKAELLKELSKVRAQGFGVDDEETFPGIRCVAAPIYGAGGTIVAAISATVPKQRMGLRRMKEIREQVIATAQSISEGVKRNHIGA